MLGDIEDCGRHEFLSRIRAAVRHCKHFEERGLVCCCSFRRCLFLPPPGKRKTAKDAIVNDFIASIFRHVFELHKAGKASELRHYGAETKKPEAAARASSGLSRFVTETFGLGGKRGREAAFHEETKFISDGGVFWRGDFGWTSKSQEMVNQAMEMGFEASLVCKCLKGNPKLDSLYSLTEKLLEEPAGSVPGFFTLASNFGPIVTAAALSKHRDETQCENELNQWRESFKLGSKVQREKTIPNNVFLSAVEFLSERLRNFKK